MTCVPWLSRSGFPAVGIIYALITSGAIAARPFAGKKRVESGPEELAQWIPLHQDFVTGVRQCKALAGLEAAREIFRRRGIGGAVGAGREDQNRGQDPARLLHILEAPHEAEGGIDPADRRIADGKLGRRLDDRRPPCVTPGVGPLHLALASYWHV